MSRLRKGDWVEVRSQDEILATLDADGRLGGLPFMPEMLAFCGRRFQVGASAHKTCDTATKTGARSMPDTVHLEDLRCDGSDHGGCQAECLLFWREAWLKPSGPTAPDAQRATAGCNADRLAELAVSHAADGELRYSCQATLLPEASDPCNPRDPGPYWQDWRSGNVGLGELVEALFFRFITNAMRIRGYSFFMGLYNGLQRLRGGIPYPIIQGKVTGKTPREELGLQPGERVRVKSLSEIEETIDPRRRNRGMRFDWEMVPYCGKTMVVRSRVERIINEETGEMMGFANPCIILEDGICRSRFSDRGRINCPRAIYSYWRENWLERVDG